MTVETTLSKKIYQGNGVTRDFPVPFPVVDEKSLHLIVTDADNNETPVTSNFVVRMQAGQAEAVTYPVTGEPLPAGKRLTLYRRVPRTQPVDLTNAGAFHPDELERMGFDRIVMMVQELQEQADRAVVVQISEEGKTPTELIDGIYKAAADATTANEESKVVLEEAKAATRGVVDAAGRVEEAARRAEEAAREAETVIDVRIGEVQSQVDGQLEDIRNELAKAGVFKNVVEFHESGEWEVPEGVTTIFVEVKGGDGGFGGAGGAGTIGAGTVGYVGSCAPFALTYVVHVEKEDIISFLVGANGANGGGGGVGGGTGTLRSSGGGGGGGAGGGDTSASINGTLFGIAFGGNGGKGGTGGNGYNSTVGGSGGAGGSSGGYAGGAGGAGQGKYAGYGGAGGAGKPGTNLGAYTVGPSLLVGRMYGESKGLSGYIKIFY